jgi:hypothetical protein
MGAGFQVGKEYLIFASEEGARDYRPDADFFWFGWTDVLAPGTPMLQPRTGCMPGGDLLASTVRLQLRRLGRGRIPKK